MRHFFTMLRNKLTGTRSKKPFLTRPKVLQVAVPGAGFLPLPKAPREEISVPASINGRDLSTGRL